MGVVVLVLPACLPSSSMRSLAQSGIFPAGSVVVGFLVVDKWGSAMLDAFSEALTSIAAGFGASVFEEAVALTSLAQSGTAGGVGLSFGTVAVVAGGRGSSVVVLVTGLTVVIAVVVSSTTWTWTAPASSDALSSVVVVPFLELACISRYQSGSFGCVTRGNVAVSESVVVTGCRVVSGALVVLTSVHMEVLRPCTGGWREAWAPVPPPTLYFAPDTE
mmetsp:Transcript_55749/g.154307  ORF Transcript_55749/g.154307 Transcript_55749/m.154307 type:complete len:218 (-) Transcript_55749:691-1344(-)